MKIQYNIIQIIKNIPLQRKLIGLFTSFIIIPLIIQGIFSSNFYSKEILNSFLKSIELTNTQIVNNIDVFLNDCIKLSEYPINDADIMSILRKCNLNNKVDNFNVANDFLYEKIKLFSTNIDSVNLYGVNYIGIVGRCPVDNLNANYLPHDEIWFKETVSLNGKYKITGVHKNIQKLPGDELTVSISRSIIDPYPKQNLGVIVINIPLDRFKNLLSDIDIGKDTRFYILDENETCIFSKDSNQIGHKFINLYDKSVLELGNKSKFIKLSNQDFYYVIKSSNISKWNTVMLIPKSNLYSYLNIMYRITILIAVIIIFCSIISAILIATSISKPLNILNSKMKLIGSGNLDIDLKNDGGEIGEISNTVNNMVIEIKRLIQNIYKNEEEKRKLQMNTLQSQINPHFLYNSLNAIKWMANMQGATGIENAISSLSGLFTFITKNSDEFTTISDEINFVRDYISLLEIRYYNKFTVDFNINENIYNYKTLKLILQPIIENSIYHGFEGIDHKGKLEIIGELEDNKVKFIVKDNGKGMEQDVLSHIFDHENPKSTQRFNSIGLSNIRSRIKIYFKDDIYGLTIKSAPGIGTEVTLVIPAIYEL